MSSLSRRERSRVRITSEFAYSEVKLHNIAVARASSVWNEPE